MKITKQVRREAKALFRACLADGLLDENRVRRAVQETLDAGPRGYVAILTHFQRLVKLDLDRRSVRVETAVPLAPSQQAGVREQLARRHGPGLAFAFVVNPDLIGGMRVRVGSDVYDGTIRGRLAALDETL
ncbi:MAG: F0F1 ATP synthase subunit delta [Verrucomicrobia bacterium]|nr:F0F1 ATP synthase subunit delta [Verrucomicrobiota bacterium]